MNSKSAKMKILIPLFFVLTSVLVACGGRHVISWTFPRGKQYETRGQDLYFGLATCVSCHGDNSEWFTRLGGWTARQLRVAIKDGVNRDGDQILEHAGYEWMSDHDALSIIAFLGTRAGVFKESSKMWEEVSSNRMPGFVPAIDPKYQFAYGRYIVDSLARCGSCHNGADGYFSKGEYLAGGNEIEIKGRSVKVPALKDRAAAFANWSEMDMQGFFQHALRPDGSYVDHNLCPVEFFGRGEAHEVDAMIVYLHSLKS